MTWRSRTTHVVVRNAMVLIALGAALVLLIWPEQRNLSTAMADLVVTGLFGGLLWLGRRGHVRRVNWLAPAVMLGLMALSALHGRVPFDVVVGGLLLTTLLATLLAGIWGGVVYGALAWLIAAALLLRPYVAPGFTWAPVPPLLHALQLAVLCTGTVLLVGEVVRLMHGDFQAQRAAVAALAAAEHRLLAADAALAEVGRQRDAHVVAMSHDIRIPLTTLLGTAEALQAGVYGPLDDRQQRAVDSIGRSGAYLLELVNNELDFGQSEAGRLHLRLGPVDLEMLCDVALTLIAPEVQRKQLTVHYSPAAGVRTLTGDERRLLQVLLNLLSNAVKFTPAGGTIGMEVAGTAAGQVRFVIWDTGIGIAPQEQSQLFEPFVRLGDDVSRRVTGSGLGLVIVKRLVEAHGGSIRVESRAGAGSRFVLLFPQQGPPV